MQEPAAVIECVDDGAVQIEADEEALSRALWNLLDNAVKYTPAGGTADISVASRAGQAIVSVEDSGPGIPPEERERVFDRFYRVAGSEAAGSGLGLAIIKAIAERHGVGCKLRPEVRAQHAVRSIGI